MKYLIFILSLIFVCSLGYSQKTLATAKQVKESVVYNVGGDSEADTASKLQTKYYYVQVTPYCDYIKIRSTITKKTGYAKSRTIIQTSLDGNTWVAKDTIALASTTTATGLSDLINPKDKFIRILQTPYDSTQVIYYKYTILIEKGK